MQRSRTVAKQSCFLLVCWTVLVFDFCIQRGYVKLALVGLGERLRESSS